MLYYTMLCYKPGEVFGVPKNQDPFYFAIPFPNMDGF